MLKKIGHKQSGDLLCGYPFKQVHTEDKCIKSEKISEFVSINLNSHV